MMEAHGPQNGCDTGVISKVGKLFNNPDMSDNPNPKMAAACGTLISCETGVLWKFGEHFNNPDMSDVTITVGSQSYYVHRFVLATQSSVFSSMLMDSKWKESKENMITLEESPEGNNVFSDFLKFFYTGKMTLNSDNVCAIHMLADKYDVQLLKEQAKSVIREVLMGDHGDALASSLMWLAFIEQFIPDLLPACYEALQNNFYGCVFAKHEHVKLLESRHLREILARTGSDKDAVVNNEHSVFKFVETWASLKFTNLSSNKAKSELKTILPLIRFHNIEGNDLQAIEESKLSQAIGKSFITLYIAPAYKVRSQLLSIVANISKRRVSMDGTYVHVDNKCVCDPMARCPHMSPRYYFAYPFGSSVHIELTRNHFRLAPIDLDDFNTYAKVFTQFVENRKQSWGILVASNYQCALSSSIKETITVTPAPSDIGRRFTVCVSIIGPVTDSKYRYSIKRTGTVKKSKNKNAEPIILHSPRRPKGSWEIRVDDKFWFGSLVHLHKK